MKPESWKDCKAWRDEGMPLSTANNEAARMVDATIWQSFCFKNDASVGGTSGTMKALFDADPKCIMGHLIKNYGAFGLGERKRNLKPDYISKANEVLKLADEVNATERERMHCQALHFYAQGRLGASSDVWQQILVKYPRDLLALVNEFFCCIHRGESFRMRDLTTRTIPHFSSKEPAYGYILGLHCFALEECGDYGKAEKYGKEALNINRTDAWATHAMAHTLEMQSRSTEGAQFMESTESNWNTSDMLAQHDYWHWGLFHIEEGNYEAALSIYDNNILPVARSTKGSYFPCQDLSSLLYRLQLEGQNVGNRWTEVCQYWSPKAEDHCTAFNDMHILMSLLGANDQAKQEQFVQSLKDYLSSDNDEDNHSVMSVVGWPLSLAMIAFEEQRYSDCIQHLLPVRYKVWMIGGSHAQRDVSNLLLISAALRSSDPEHRQLAEGLLVERGALREGSSLVQRWTKLL